MRQEEEVAITGLSSDQIIISINRDCKVRRGGGGSLANIQLTDGQWGGWPLVTASDWLLSHPLKGERRGISRWVCRNHFISWRLDAVSL